MKGEREEWKKNRQKGGRVETSGEKMSHEIVLGTTMKQECKRQLGRGKKKKKTKQEKCLQKADKFEIIKTLTFGLHRWNVEDKIKY